MKLTRSLDIALTALIQLASSDTRLNSGDIAGILGAPRNHVAKVIQLLARNGYIRTVRGKGGGIRLAKAPGDVTLKEIIDLVEGEIYLMECTIRPGTCPMSPRCRLGRVFRKAQGLMLEVFHSTTLADVLPPGARPAVNKTRKKGLHNLKREEEHGSDSRFDR
ncbi:MAG: Rrf2 family transcriptional regulator [Acidobacteriota bacterium]|nr:Rrf2 family transcriptional regulator [Acidobacteriota bacterium]